MDGVKLWGRNMAVGFIPSFLEGNGGKVPEVSVWIGCENARVRDKGKVK